MMRGKGKDKGKGKRKRGTPKAKVGVLFSWEDFDDAAMLAYMDKLAEDLDAELREQERSFRGSN